MSDQLQRVHRLKTHPQMWAEVSLGVKTFEVRKDDRGFRIGDMLELMEWPVEGKECLCTRSSCMSRPAILRRQVLYILRGGEWGIEPGYVVLGIGGEDD